MEALLSSRTAASITCLIPASWASTGSLTPCTMQTEGAARAVVLINVTSPTASPAAMDDEFTVDTNGPCSSRRRPCSSMTTGPGGPAHLRPPHRARARERTRWRTGVLYIPPADFHGDVSFTYAVSDGATTSAPATILVHVIQTDTTSHHRDYLALGRWRDRSAQPGQGTRRTRGQ